jgi:hypothetical protein
MTQPDVPKFHRKKRFNFSSSWMAWGLLSLFSAAGWMRALDAWTDRYWLDMAGVEPGIGYFVVSGAFWGLVGLAGAAALLFRVPHSRKIAFTAAALIALTFWLDRLLFNRAPGSSGNMLFALLATILLLGAAAYYLTSRRERDQLWRKIFRRS